ncbi:hypothetical protein LV85_01008 [Algoriphagus chordae]|uniref:Uncharacterized protein n=1 Tax=Algoriphagus chordae TaxID=237019 RepID=A0A2W7R4L7_9BACT|nr:hypothetical protein LV85_01008 [Algoriphagus chordae]
MVFLSLLVDKRIYIKSILKLKTSPASREAGQLSEARLLWVYGHRG